MTVSYNDGILLFLNGHYIDGALSRDNGQLFFLLPLQKGENILTIRLYNRWAEEATISVSLPVEYELYTQTLPTGLINEGLIDIRKARNSNLASPVHLSPLRLEQ